MAKQLSVDAGIGNIRSRKFATVQLTIDLNITFYDVLTLARWEFYFLALQFSARTVG